MHDRASVYRHLASPIGVCRRMAELGGMVDLCLAFCEFSTLISIVAAAVWIPPAVSEGVHPHSPPPDL